MDKSATLESIQKIRHSHQLQMEKIEALLKGKKVDSPTTFEETECTFGKWLYSEEGNLKKILGTLFYSNIETVYAKWHSEYRGLFNIFFKNQKKKGFFSKLTGASKVDGMDIGRAELYYAELKITTNQLLKSLDMCERRIQALNDSKFS